MLVIITTKKEFTREEFGNYVHENYLMSIDLKTKIVFEKDLKYLDYANVNYTVFKKLKKEEV